MAQAADSIRRARPLLGTFVEIFAAGLDETRLETAVETAFGSIEKVHRLMSFHERDSDVSKLNREAHIAPVKVHPWTFEVLQLSMQLHAASGGAFNIAVAPALHRLGFLPATGAHEEISAAEIGCNVSDGVGFELLDGHRVRFQRRDIQIDLGGIAKGFAVDRAVETLKAVGAASGAVNAGGDIAVFGEKRQKIHLRDPRDPRALLSEVELSNRALASSGGRFDPFTCGTAGRSAIVEPRTGKAIEAVAGAAVIAPACVIADALTKPVMILGETSGALLRAYDARALIVCANGSVLHTPGWEGLRDLAA
ncbi:MAG TPA: FAD:protein FMN transferase [Hyphomicrobiales bacterium]|nr:FAD:protein FMN transferase [Hyphomicrobiales bacterium]